MLPRTAGWGPIALVLGALFPAACSSGGGGGNGDASPGSASPEPFATLAALNLQQGSFLKIGIPATPVPTALVVKSESVRALASIDLSDPDRPSSRRSRFRAFSRATSRFRGRPPISPAIRAG